LNVFELLLISQISQKKFTADFFEIIDELFIDRHIGRKKTAVIFGFLSSDDERLEPKIQEKETHILLRCFKY
jgi:hypothetical protein